MTLDFRFLTFNFKKGQMLIEVLIVLSIVTVGLMALISSVIVALKNTSFSKQSALANHQAQTAMEGVRIYKNTEGFWRLINGCYYSNSINIESIPQTCNDFGWTGPRIKITGDTTQKTITVINRWGGACDGIGACHQAEVVSYVNKWSRE